MYTLITQLTVYSVLTVLTVSKKTRAAWFLRSENIRIQDYTSRSLNSRVLFLSRTLYLLYRLKLTNNGH